MFLLKMHSTHFISTNDIRSKFTQAMSEMYQLEVPLYKTFLSLADSVNEYYLDHNNSLKLSGNENNLLGLEHHGAIRLGTASELSIVRRLFAVMGMYPVDYYDLSAAGIPVHSTAFRALEKTDLDVSPFRVFCSLLRLDLIDDVSLRKQAQDLLHKRQIIPNELLTLIQSSENQGGLSQKQVDSFIQNTLNVFRWHKHSTVDKNTYQILKASHGLTADVVSFKGPHINHLTPKVLDIDACQRQFSQKKIKAKAFIEGPPKRRCPILLRQTSFIAIAEKIVFSDGELGEHSARFGEVEQRGIALTPKGRELYDQLLLEAKHGDSNIDFKIRLQESFKDFPDSYDEMRLEQLAYFNYSLTSFDEYSQPISDNIEELLRQGLLKASPIIYEDFLPISAAGIFSSNLSKPEKHDTNENELEVIQEINKINFENALGVNVESSFSLYEKQQRQSLKESLIKLGFDA